MAVGAASRSSSSLSSYSSSNENSSECLLENDDEKQAVTSSSIDPHLKGDELQRYLTDQLPSQIPSMLQQQAAEWCVFLLECPTEFKEVVKLRLEEILVAHIQEDISVEDTLNSFHEEIFVFLQDQIIQEHFERLQTFLEVLVLSKLHLSAKQFQSALILKFLIVRELFLKEHHGSPPLVPSLVIAQLEDLSNALLMIDKQVFQIPSPEGKEVTPYDVLSMAVTNLIYYIRYHQVEREFIAILSQLQQLQGLIAPSQCSLRVQIEKLDHPEKIVRPDVIQFDDTIHHLILGRLANTVTVPDLQYVKEALSQIQQFSWQQGYQELYPKHYRLFMQIIDEMLSTPLSGNDNDVMRSYAHLVLELSRVPDWKDRLLIWTQQVPRLHRYTSNLLAFQIPDVEVMIINAPQSLTINLISTILIESYRHIDLPDDPQTAPFGLSIEQLLDATSIPHISKHIPSSQSVGKDIDLWLDGLRLVRALEQSNITLIYMRVLLEQLNSDDLCSHKELCELIGETLAERVLLKLGSDDLSSPLPLFLAHTLQLFVSRIQHLLRQGNAEDIGPFMLSTVMLLYRLQPTRFVPFLKEIRLQQRWILYKERGEVLNSLTYESIKLRALYRIFLNFSLERFKIDSAFIEVTFEKATLKALLKLILFFETWKLAVSDPLQFEFEEMLQSIKTYHERKKNLLALPRDPTGDERVENDPKRANMRSSSPLNDDS